MNVVVKQVAAWIAVLTSVVAISTVTPLQAASGPCGTLPLASTNYAHVVSLWMENHSYDTIIGSPDAPYINGLAASSGLATNYHVRRALPATGRRRGQQQPARVPTSRSSWAPVPTRPSHSC